MFSPAPQAFAEDGQWPAADFFPAGNWMKLEVSDSAVFMGSFLGQRGSRSDPVAVTDVRAATVSAGIQIMLLKPDDLYS